MKEPIWLSVARMSKGLAEIPGPLSNPVILQWARDIGAPAWYHNDDQPWCMVWFNRLMLACQIPMALGDRGDQYDRLRALTGLTWGQPMAAASLGAAMIFSRPEGAHIGLYVGESPNAFKIYGGNQSNQVCETWIGRDRLRGVRWPPGFTAPTPAPVLLSRNGQSVSRNEA